MIADCCKMDGQAGLPLRGRTGREPSSVAPLFAVVLNPNSGRSDQETRLRFRMFGGEGLLQRT